MENIKELFIALLDEGTPVWRPVVAIHNNDGTFLICEQKIPEDECWQFEPGDVVIAEEQIKGGQTVWVAVRRAMPLNVAM